MIKSGVDVSTLDLQTLEASDIEKLSLDQVFRLWHRIVNEHQTLLAQISKFNEKIEKEERFRHFGKRLRTLRRQKKAAGTKCSRLQCCLALLKPRLSAAKSFASQKAQESLVDPIEYGPDETLLLRELFAAFHRIVSEEDLELWPDEQALLAQIEVFLDGRRRSLRSGGN